MARTKQADTHEEFSPVAFNPAAYAANRSSKDKAFKAAYEAMDAEFSMIEVVNNLTPPLHC